MSLYVDPDDLKVTLKVTTSEWNDDIERACFAASGAIDEHCDTVFALSDDTEDEVRVFTPTGPTVCVIDDASSITEVAVDQFGAGSYGEWTSDDYMLFPENAAAKGKPFQYLKVRNLSAKCFNVSAPQSVQVTGRYGWAETPAQVVEAAGLLATQLWKRRREAPFGILGLDQQTAARVLRYDPHLQALLEPFQRLTMVA